MKIKEDKSLTTFAYRIASQAQYARDADEITDREYYVLLTVFSRVHAQYNLELKRAEISAKLARKSEIKLNLIVGVTLLALGVFWYGTTL